MNLMIDRYYYSILFFVLVGLNFGKVNVPKTNLICLG
jgi:hypothetical protein